MSEVKVIRRHRPAPFRPSVRRPFVLPAAVKALGIVTSTGGPNALVQLLGKLEPDFPAPVFVVQHIASGFLDAFADWLAQVSPFPVQIVHKHCATAPGTIYVACPDHHLVVGRGVARTARTSAVCGQRPSGNVLFESMADSLGSRSLGVLLTGMGEDGAEGLLRIHQSGGYTIAEDESTAVVYGMPAAAVRLGGVSESLPLHAIAPRIRELVPANGEVA
jgi:two-component system chemotaxis response regulator CheB